MSENGTFIKSSNSNEFLKKDASVKLNHGDIVRFGSYELIICLVPKI
jgi:pSer/pThr/pTyr-binding forkhead associated (FHA) protein